MTIFTSSLIHSGGLSFNDLVRDLGEHWDAPDEVVFATRSRTNGSFINVFFNKELKLEVGFAFNKPSYFSIEPYGISTSRSLVVDDAKLFEKSKENIISELGLNLVNDDTYIYRMLKFYFYNEGELYSIMQEFH